MKQKSLHTKIISSVLLFTFSCSQLLYAADTRQMLLDAKAFFEAEDAKRPHGMSSEDLQASQTQQQAVADQQQLLQDFQNTTFNLTTQNGDVLEYVGNKLSAVTRPDGTELKNVTTDLNGNITNADLRLSDGSIQIYQSGQVLGYQTPDGSQVIYQNGVIQKVIDKTGKETLYTYLKDASGKVMETTLDNLSHTSKYDANGKLKEVTRKSDNQKIYYNAGVIQKIVNADASQILFTSQKVGADTVVTPPQGASDVFIDAQGNKFYFSGGSVSKVVLPDNSEITGITWDSNNKIDSATLTQSDLQKFVYQSKQLTRSYDAAGVVTNYTYTASGISANNTGNTYEYLTDKTPVKFTDLNGNVTTYILSGVYKGLKDKEILSTGQTFLYEYSGSALAPTVQKRETQASIYKTITFDGNGSLVQSTNPAFKFNLNFLNDGSIDQSVVAQGTATGKSLKVNLVSGNGSTYTWNGTTTSLAISLNKGTDYKYEMLWEAGRVGIYIYNVSQGKPSTPAVSITDRAWDPTFKSIGTNVLMVSDSTSSGYYNRNYDVRDKNYAYLSTGPAMSVTFKPRSHNYRPVTLKATQAPSGAITRTLTFFTDTAGSVWSFRTSDYNSSTGTTTNTTTTLNQPLTSGVEYVADVRLEGTMMNLYVYTKGSARSVSPTASLNAFAVSTKFEASIANGDGKDAVQLKNLTAPAYSSVFTAKTLTARTDTVQNLTLTKPSAPSGLNPTDFSSITYDALGNLKQVIFKDNSKLIFENGILKQALDPTGKSTAFDFEESSLSNVTGSSIVQSSLTSTYSAEGKLESIKTNDLTVHYKKDGTSVEWIEKLDGTELWNLVFDQSGNLTDALIIAPDGEERIYTASKLTQLRRPDQSRLFYASNQVTKIITPENLIYNFNYTTPGIVQAVLDSTVLPVPDALTPVKMEYDTNFNLKKVTRQNQEVLNYLNPDLKQIDTPSTTSKVFNYTKDIAGKILSYTVTQGNVITTYDANNQPMSSVINLDAANPNLLNVTYQYGKIRQVKKNSVVTFNYSYSFDAAGTELTHIQDLETNTNKTYQGSNLMSSLDNDTSVLSSYTYANGKVSQVKVSRFGRVLHTYDYAYDSTNTIVKDEFNIVRTYDANKKLIKLERDGQKFAYTYVSQAMAGTTQTATQTVLPVNTLGTSSRSVSPDSWSQWVVNTSEASLGIGSWGWVKYDTNLPQGGDLKIEFDSTNYNGAIPSNYQFQLDITLDGVKKMQYVTPAGTGWKTNQLILTGLSAGTHSIQITWANDYYVAGQYDANFKFKNLKMTHLYQTAPPAVSQEIVEESLVEKKLLDGSIARYTVGKLTEIERPDGRVMKNIVTDGVGNILEGSFFATATATAGTKYYFADGQISKVVMTDAKVLLYSYDKDLGGNIVNTWIKKGVVNLKYDTSNNLQGVKIDGVMTPQEVKAATLHTYSGGIGDNSIDGDFNTYQGLDVSCTGCGGIAAQAMSEHSFSFTQNQVIRDITFKIYVSGYAHGNYTRDYNALYYIEVLRNGVWEKVPNSSDSCSGGDGSCLRDSGVKTLTGVNLDNMSSIRAFASGFGNASGGEGSSGGSAYIYEIQYVLADLANLTFSKTTGTNGQVTGYTLNGYKGNIKYDGAGNVTQANSNYTAVQNELTNVIQNYVSILHKYTDFDIAREVMLDTQAVFVQEYSADGALETQTKVDGTVTLFENNKPSKVLDSSGRILIQYAYDASGNPTRIYLKNARDTLPDEVLKAKQSIEQQRAQALRDFAAQKNLAYQSIQSAYQDQRLSIQAQLTSWQNQFNDLSNLSVKGKAAKSARGDQLNALGNAIQDARIAITTSYDNEADSYANLDAQVKTVSDKIEADSQSAFTELSNQETNLKKEILRQEVSPIVYDYYRRILGRDPDTNEYNYWIGRIDYNSGNKLAESKTTTGQNLTTALNTYITALPELSQRQTYVNTIKNNVTSQINSYLAMTQAQKDVFAATLGLTPQDLISLTSSDGQKILTWLNSRNLHFGQSAFLALESLLDQKGIVYTRTDLAQKAILVDLLTGVISPLDDGDLVISVFSLNKVAQGYGLALNGANLTWDDLLKVYQTNPTARVIAHVRDNHFVIVTGITSTSITYIDPGKGKDKQNEVVTLAKADFLKGWKGNVSLEQTKLQSVTNYQTKILSAEQTKNIRGAFFFFLIPLFISFAASIGGAVASVIAGISAIIGSIGALVGTVLSGIGQVLSGIGGLLQGIGSALWQGISFAASSIFNAIGNVGTFLSQNVFGSIAKASFGNTLFQTAVKVGFSVATTKGLEALGVNSTIANLASAFVTGGITGGFNAGFTAANFIQGGIKGLALQGTQTVLQNASIDSTLSQTLLTIASPFIDGIQTGNIAGATVKIIQDLPKSLSLYGLQKAGDAIGLSPLVSTAIAAPISITLGQNFQTGNSVGQNLIQSIQQGLTSGAVAYAVNVASSRITNNAILNSLTSRVIAGAIEGIFVQHDVFKGIKDALGNAILGVFSPNPNQPLMDVINFSQTIAQKGMNAALEVYLTNIFNRGTVESVLRSGGVATALLSPKQQITLPDGSTAQLSVLGTGEGVLFDASNQLIGFERDGLYQKGSFGTLPDGRFGMTGGKMMGTLPNGQYVEATIVNGKVISIKSVMNQLTLDIKPENQGPYIKFDAQGEIVESQIKAGDKITLTIANGLLDGIQGIEDVANQGITTASQKAAYVASIVNQILLLDGPATTVYDSASGLSQGVKAVDMKLDWFNAFEAAKWPVFTTDVAFLGQIANYRWSTAISDALPKTVQEIQNPLNKFILITGVNSGVKIGNNLTGFTPAQINTLAGVFGASSKKVVIGHSAGTEDLLKSIVEAKKAGTNLDNYKFVFASPRVTRSTFESYIKQAGLRPDQVLVVTADKDFWHWPTDIFDPQNLTTPTGLGIGATVSASYDYQNNKDSNGQIKYNYVFLEMDLTYQEDPINNQELLGHGGMIEGAIANHEYQLTKNGVRILRTRLRDLYVDYTNGNF